MHSKEPPSSLDVGAVSHPPTHPPTHPSTHPHRVMGLSHELSRYAIKRASSLDVSAVSRCRDLLTILNGKLLEFEFRNGGLRRKYDGVKWGGKKKRRNSTTHPPTHLLTHPPEEEDSPTHRPTYPFTNSPTHPPTQ